MACRTRWRRAATGCILAFALALGVVSPARAETVHWIQPGETLSALALRYGVPLHRLAISNGISDPDTIYAGQPLVIPPAAGADGTSTSFPAVTYTVQPGDTLWGIAARFGVSVPQLLALNSIVEPDHIVAGQTIVLPESAAWMTADVDGLLAAYAREYGLDPALVQALAWQESGWQQHVVSAVGAAGVMQVTPETGAWVAAFLVGRPLDIHGSVSDNIVAGVAYLAWLIRSTGDVELALAAYNQGPGSVARFGLFPETRQFVANVLAIRDAIARYGSPPPPS